MRPFMLFLVILLLSCKTSSDVASTHSLAHADLAIQGVNYFDSVNKQIIQKKTILIKEDKIHDILDEGSPFTADKTIDGTGKLLIPGFVDTHIHLRQMLDLSSGIAPKQIDKTYRKKLQEKVMNYGTTTAIDMGQPEAWMEECLSWQSHPSPLFPNNYLVGAAMISDLSWNRRPAQHHTVIKDPEAGIQKVKKYAQMGAQYIKLYWKLEQDDMEEIISEAQAQDLHIHAHVDQNIVTIPQALKLGVKHFEHFFTVMPSIMDYDIHWDRMNQKYDLPKSQGHIDDFSIAMLYFFKYVHDDKVLEDSLFKLFDEMAAQGASISTAIHVLAAVAEETPFFSSFSHFPIRKRAARNAYTRAHKKDLKEACQIMMKYLKVAYEKGVKICIGTDTREAGKAMLSELHLLARYGFEMEDVLQIATWNGATETGLHRQIASIEPGKQADLLLFDQDPFEQADHLWSDKLIIKSGKVYEPIPSGVDQTLQILEKESWETAVSQSKQMDLQAYEMVEIAYHFLNTGYMEGGLALLAMTEEKYPNFQPIYYEDILNRVGYEMMGKKRMEEAIMLFKKNVQAFPNSWNVYDSLGEAYLAVGEKELGIANYEKSLELNPDNEPARKILKELGRK